MNGVNSSVGIYRFEKIVKKTLVLAKMAGVFFVHFFRFAEDLIIKKVNIL